jgi:acylphosphatase
MANAATLHVIIHGHVQGVFFRAFVIERATELGLAGYVRNLPSGQDIEIQADGEKEKLEKLVEYLKIGPPAARVERVITTWSKYTGKYSHFTIRN